jgi:hypothetical protein
LHPVNNSFQGATLPMYEEITKGIESEKLENKKLLVYGERRE